jgi:hypothetical protein
MRGRTMGRLDTDEKWLYEKLGMVALGEAAGYWEGVKWHLCDNHGPGRYTPDSGGDEIPFDPVERLHRLAKGRPEVQAYLEELQAKLDTALEYESIHGRLSLAVSDHPFWRLSREHMAVMAAGVPRNPPEPSDLAYLCMVFGPDAFKTTRPSVSLGQPSSV